MTEKLDNKAFVTPAARAAQSGIGVGRTMMIVNKVNEIIDALGTVATATAVASINTQLTTLTAAQNALLTQLNALTGRVAALEIAPAEGIANVSESLVSISVGNLVNIGTLGTNSAAQAATINKMLAVMRTRKEIKT